MSPKAVFAILLAIVVVALGLVFIKKDYKLRQAASTVEESGSAETVETDTEVPVIIETEEGTVDLDKELNSLDTSIESVIDDELLGNDLTDQELGL